jgi:hypothetical protein
MPARGVREYVGVRIEHVTHHRPVTVARHVIGRAHAVHGHAGGRPRLRDLLPASRRVRGQLGRYGTVTAVSPVTGETYQMQCTGGSPVVCMGGTNAIVEFYT